jgi:hypothetical protein
VTIDIFTERKIMGDKIAQEKGQFHISEQKRLLLQRYIIKYTAAGGSGRDYTFQSVFFNLRINRLKWWKLCSSDLSVIQKKVL